MHLNGVLRYLRINSANEVQSRKGYNACLPKKTAVFNLPNF